MFDDVDKLISDIYENEDILKFREYLTPFEDSHFVAEEDRIKALRLDLIRKYNKKVSDRLSHSTLIEELQKVLSSHSAEMRAKLDLMDNKTLQSILSVVSLAKKENKKPILGNV